MTTFSLLYVSHSCLPSISAESEVAAIVHTSLDRNRRDEITGALFYTGNLFAQILEGGESPVRSLMDVIARDARHNLVDVVDTRLQAARDFPSWSLAYTGRASYVENHILPLIRPSAAVRLDRLAIMNLRRLMAAQVAAAA